MPYTRITNTKYGEAAIRYVLSGKGHDGLAERNAYITSVGLLPGDDYIHQMKMYWKQMSSRNKTQIRRCISSFSTDELDPYNDEDILIGAKIEMETCQKAFPNHPVLICLQRDGKGHKLHAHNLVCGVNAVTLKGFSSEMRHKDHFRKIHDSITEQYIGKRNEGQGEKDKITQEERGMSNNLSGASSDYIWKDDLRNRIIEAMNMAKNREDFLEKLPLVGVEGEYRTSENGHASKIHGDYILYELTDTTGFDGKIPGNLRCKSYKLGSGYGFAALDEKIKDNMNISPAITAEDINSFILNKLNFVYDPDFEKCDYETGTP